MRGKPPYRGLVTAYMQLYKRNSTYPLMKRGRKQMHTLVHPPLDARPQACVCCSRASLRRVDSDLRPVDIVKVLAQAL